MNILLLLAVFWSGPAMAAISDTTIGNGGDVVKHQPEGDGQRYYLLDLFETGLAENPYFDESIEVPTHIQERLNKAFNHPGTASLLGRKIAEIVGRDKLLGYSLLRTMELLQWRFVSYPLKNVPDEGTVYDGELFQAAIRQGTTIFLQGDLWAQMANDKQRAALVLHELLYALYKPEALKEGLKVQRSYRVREINSYFFDERWRQYSAEEFYRMVDGKLPTSGESGVKIDAEDANLFSLAPMLSVAGSIPMSDTVSVYAFAGLRSKRPEEINEKERINYFCRSFSSPQALEHKSDFYSMALLKLWVRLQRSAYNSPLGILDYIEWSPADDFRLPPYEQNRSIFPRSPVISESYQILNSRVIFDFRKFTYSPRIAEKAKQACVSFLESGLKEFGPLLNEYQ